MKTTLFFKRLDLYMQALLIISSIAAALIDTECLLFGYLFTGGWQVLSVLIHLPANGYYYKVPGRKIYLRALLITAIVCIITLPAFILFLFALLFVSPFMAFCYMFICKEEIDILYRKQLVHIR